MQSVMINLVTDNLNQELFNKKFDVFTVKTDMKYFKRGSMTLDTPLECKEILSILFEDGKEFYVLMKHNGQNQELLKKIISNTEDFEHLSFEQTNIEKISVGKLYQLLLNALASKNHRLLKFSNLTGHLYYLNEKWIKLNGEKKEQIIALEFAFTDDLILKMNVKTFTNIEFKDKLHFTKKKPFNAYPQYMYNERILKRKLKSDSNVESFIIKQYSNKKSVIPFLDFSSEDNFNKSKMGALAYVIERFNEKYNDIAKIEFIEQEIEKSIECGNQRKSKNNDKKIAIDILSKYKIRIIDTINNKFSNELALKMKDILQKEFNVSSAIGKRLSSDALNIRIIHNDKYYGNDYDPHDDDLSKYTVQHITLEDFYSMPEKAIMTIVHELLIKQDLKNGKISLFDWKSLDYDGDVTFITAYRSKSTDIDRYFFMNIHKDGTFDIKEIENSLFECEKYEDCFNIFEDHSDVYGVIQFPNGLLNVIHETNLITIPKIFEIKKELKSGNTKLKNKKSRETYLQSVTDIHLFSKNNNQYYFTGVIGAGMQSSVPKASRIYCAKPYNGSNLYFDTLLSLMNVLFVRNSQLTVQPFPFKYLMEYIRTNEN